MNKIITFIGFVWLILFSSCDSKYPGNVLSPDEMESFLYDYHIAQAMGNNLNATESYKRELLIDYVYRKHHVSHAVFDSSLVWYTRHSDELEKIYLKLSDRISKEKNILNADNHADQAVTASGDTVNIWLNKKLYLLTASKYTNKVSFIIKTDTSYHQRDIYKWSGNFIFLPTNSPNGQEAVMTFRIRYANDSVATETKEIRTLGENSIYLVADPVHRIKDVSGYVYYLSDNRMLLSNIRLMRYHQNDSTRFIQSSREFNEQVPALKKDTIRHDSAITLPARPLNRMNPEQMRDSKPVIRKQIIRKR